MDLDFLFSAAVGAAITEATFQSMDKVKSERIRSEFQNAMRYFRDGEYRNAISILEKLRELDPSNPIIYGGLWYSWGKLAASQRDNKSVFLSAVDKVLEYYEVILQLDRQGRYLPSDVLEEVKKYTPMFQTGKDILAGKKPIQSMKGGEYQHRADLAQEAGDYKKALRYITKAIEAETSDFWIATYHMKRALTKTALGDFAGASSDCETALECERLPDEGRRIIKGIQCHAKASQYAHEAGLAVQAQNAKKALQCITEAIELETDEVSIAVYRAQRAIIRKVLGDFAGALSDCRIALRCKGLDDKMREMLRDLQRSAEDSQNVQKTHSNLKSATGRVRTRTKTKAKKQEEEKRTQAYDNAIADYSKAIELNPNSADAYFNRGLAYDRMGEYSKAMSDYNTAIALNKNHALAWYKRGLVYRKRGEVSKAVIDLEKSIELLTDPKLKEAAQQALSEARKSP